MVKRAEEYNRSEGWYAACGLRRHGDRRRSTAVEPLRGDDLVVERAQVHAKLLPGVEVVCSRDRPACALRLTNGPVLLERFRALDRRRVRACAFVDLVHRPIGRHSALVREPPAGVVRPKVLRDVVLNQRARRPAVYRQVAVPARVKARGVLDCPTNRLQ